MEESKLIQRMAEASDLVGMVEELINPQMTDRLSPSGWAGVRVTLRNIREILQSTHSAMSTQMVTRAKSHAAAPQVVQPSQQSSQQPSAAPEISRPGSPISRKDLKASLERFVEQA